MKKLKLFFYDRADCQLEPGFPHRPIPVLSKPNPEFYQVVSSPVESDFIVLPVLLSDVGASRVSDQDYVYSYISTLPFFQEFEEKHLFFLPGIDTWAPLFTKATLFRHSVHRKFPDLNAIPYPYYSDLVPEQPNYDNLVYHTVFSGFLGSWKGRGELVTALSIAQGIHCYVKGMDRFHDHLPPEQRDENRKTYLESVRCTVTVCCPRGAGLNSFRFFETLASGRIPILISDECVLPFEDRIDYKNLILWLPEARIPEIEPFLLDFFAKTAPGEIARRCAAARTAWETYLSPVRQEQLVLRALRQIKAAKHALNAAQARDVANLREAMKK